MGRTRAAPSPRRKRARRGEGEKLRDLIIDAAERLLIETGDSEAVSIRAVAEAVGVTPPSIYLHFEDKNALLFAVCEKHFLRFDEVIERAGAESDDPLESLRLRGRAYIRFGLDNPEHYRILFMSKPAVTPDRFMDGSMMENSAFAHLVEAVTRSIDTGALRGEPLMVSLGLWCVVHGLTSLLIAKPDFPWPETDALVDHVLDSAIEGLRAR